MNGAIVEAKNNCEAIFYECDQLGLKVSEVDCGSNLTVSRTIRNVKVWKKT